MCCSVRQRLVLCICDALMHSCLLTAVSITVVHPDLSLSIALQEFSGLRFCQMLSSPLSLMRLGNFMVIFVPLKSEQINCIFFPGASLR